MRFSIVVHGAPIDAQGAQTALRFARAVVSQGHELYRVFFYRAGIHNATTLACLPQDEQNLPAQWQQFGQENNIDMVVCVAAAARRGVITETEAKRHEKSQFNLADGFELSGLGQLIEAIMKSDRVITFGGQS